MFLYFLGTACLSVGIGLGYTLPAGWIAEGFFLLIGIPVARLLTKGTNGNLGN